MPLDAPLTLGPFSVDANGRLRPSSPDQFPAFRVTWRGHVVQANLASARPEGGTLALRVVLGRVPSTGRPGASTTGLRDAAFAALRALPGTLPAGWKLALLPDHRIIGEAQIPIGLPAGAEDLVTELTMFLLRLDPYLDLLAEGIGVEAAAAPGTANICPG